MSENRAQLRPVDRQTTAPEREHPARPPVHAVMTPLRLLLILTTAISVGETIVMFLLPVLPPLSRTAVALLDAFLLTVLTFPATYFFSFLPLRRHINERRRLEERLLQIRAAVHDAADAVVIMDRDGVVTYVNVAFTNLFGYTRRDMKKQGTASLFSDGTASEDIVRSVLKGTRWEGEIEMRANGGGTFPALLRCSPVEDEVFRIVGVLFLCSDITDRKSAEEERAQKERLQGVIEMAGGACHELNQPLAAVSGYAELMMRDLPGDDPQYEKVQAIREQIGEMVQITRKLNRIARYETRDYVEGAKIIDIDKASGHG